MVKKKKKYHMLSFHRQGASKMVAKIFSGEIIAKKNPNLFRWKVAFNSPVRRRGFLLVGLVVDGTSEAVVSERGSTIVLSPPPPSTPLHNTSQQPFACNCRPTLPPGGELNTWCIFQRLMSQMPTSPWKSSSSQTAGKTGRAINEFPHAKELHVGDVSVNWIGRNDANWMGNLFCWIAGAIPTAELLGK